MASHSQARGGGIQIYPTAQERAAIKKPAPLQLTTPPTPTSSEILAAAAYVPQGVRPRLKARDSDTSDRTAIATPSPTRGFSRSIRCRLVSRNFGIPSSLG